jgi:hypothetical protein
MQRARAAGIARELVARCPAGSIVSIFAAGSLGRGEVWAAEIDGVIEVYSDVDLYVVTSDSSALARIRPVADALSRDASSVSGAHFLRAPEIGVYSRADLDAQPLRPGTVDLAAHHVLLYGHPDVIRGLRAREASRIPSDEALYLLENRAMEVAAGTVPAEGPGARLMLVQALKAKLDVHAAHAIVAGSFAPTLAERARRFRDDPPVTLAGDAREEVASAYAATATLTAWLRGRDVGAETRATLSALARAWRSLAPIVMGGELRQVEDLVSRRCRAGSYVSNARDVLRLRRCVGLPLWRVAVVAPRLARLSPRPSVRIDALVRHFQAEENGAPRLAAHSRYVDELTRHFGFTAGTAEMRVRAMHRAIS